MNNHLHFIVQFKDSKLSDLIRDFKKYTAKNILKSIHSEPESRREWMLERFKKATENNAEEIYTLPFMGDQLNYIPFNPIRAGWVEKAHHYLYSSASNYDCRYH